MGKDFKILSIDGGGMKGLYSASVLRQLEQKYDAKLADHFDLICGTSTGGLIALALALYKSADDIANFYSCNGKEIFQYSYPASRFYAFLKQTFWFGKYKSSILKDKLNEFLGSENTMKDSSTLLCIPSFNLTQGKPIIFKYPHKEGGLTRDGNLRMVDVGLATSAAPTYFPIAELNYPDLNGLFVDGGVWANNPTLCGITEALKYFVGDDKEFSSYSVLSISRIDPPSGWKMGVRPRRSFLGWGDKLFQTSLDGQNHFTDYFSDCLVNSTSPKGYYLRIPSPEVSPQQINDIALDKAGSSSVRLLQSLGKQQGINYTTKSQHKLKLDHFFETKKHYVI